MIGWAILAAIYLGVAAWVFTWARAAREAVSRDQRLMLIAQAKAEEDNWGS